MGKYSRKKDELVALKAMDYVDDEDIKKEAKFLMKLNHPNVVQVKGIFWIKWIFWIK